MIFEIRFNDAECDGTGCDDYSHSNDCILYDERFDEDGEALQDWIDNSESN